MAEDGKFIFENGRGTLTKIQTSNSENKNSGASVRAQTLDELHSLQKRKSVAITPIKGAQGASEQMSEVERQKLQPQSMSASLAGHPSKIMEDDKTTADIVSGVTNTANIATTAYNALNFTHIPSPFELSEQASKDEKGYFITATIDLSETVSSPRDKGVVNDETTHNELVQWNGFNDRNEGIESIFNFNPSLTKNENNNSFQNLSEDFALQSEANFGNSPYDCIPQQMIPQRQFPMPVTMDTPWWPQTEFILNTSSTWVRNGNLNFQVGFCNNEHSYQIPNESNTEHIPFQEMNKIISERRNHRSKLRREYRSKERRPYQRRDKTSAHNNNKYKGLYTSRPPLPPQAKDQTKTQFSEEGLKFLLEKKLQPSDVSSLGRIVLPKRDAEANLPHLDVKEGIEILAQDWENNIAWDLKYRYWPNNKTRMYVLEKTGYFVQAHGLQTGDYMMLYKDAHDNFVIKGRKSTELILTTPNTINIEAKVEDGIEASVEDGRKSTELILTTPNTINIEVKVKDGIEEKVEDVSIEAKVEDGIEAKVEDGIEKDHVEEGIGNFLSTNFVETVSESNSLLPNSRAYEFESMYDNYLYDEFLVNFDFSPFD